MGGMLWAALAQRLPRVLRTIRVSVMSQGVDLTQQTKETPLMYASVAASRASAITTTTRKANPLCPFSRTHRGQLLRKAKPLRRTCHGRTRRWNEIVSEYVRLMRHRVGRPEDSRHHRT